MKGSYTFLTPLSSTFPLISSILQNYHQPYYQPFRRSVASSSSSVTPISTSPISHKPQIPLFLRPPIYSTTQPDLHNFITWAKTLATSIGSTFVQIDDGPDSTLLLRELNWFLDDAVEDPLEVSHRTSGSSSKRVCLRASLDEMYKLWGRRIQERMPFQYIVGCEHWRDLVLSVEQGVLIPRPETGKIVDLVQEVVLGEFHGFKEGGVWADLGTGSGALAIAISRVLGKDGRVVATDLSPVAVAVASYNVERYGLQDRIKVKQGSWFEPLVEFKGQLAGVVSNPPYIPSEDISGLQAEVGKHEPMLALDGGVEGMDDLFHLCTKLPIMLKPGGFFIFETNGEKQCKILADYLKNVTGNCFRDVTIISDFAGIMRFVTGRCI